MIDSKSATARRLRLLACHCRLAADSTKEFQAARFQELREAAAALDEAANHIDRYIGLRDHSGLPFSAVCCQCHRPIPMYLRNQNNLCFDCARPVPSQRAPRRVERSRSWIAQLADQRRGKD